MHCPYVPVDLLVIDYMPAYSRMLCTIAPGYVLALVYGYGVLSTGKRYLCLLWCCILLH